MHRSLIALIIKISCLLMLPETAFAQLQTLLLFNEAGGTTAADSTINGRHGTLVNGPARVTGKGGNAVDLDGTNDYVSLPTGVVSALSNFTISTWVNLDAASPWSRIFDFGSGTTNYMFLTPANGSTGTVRFAITTGGGEQIIDGTAALPTGAWTHVAVTLSGNLGILYVNGVEVGRNAALTLTPMSLGATTQNWIGRSQYPDPYLNGRVDDFRIYGNALAASDVLALYNGTAGALPEPWASQDIGFVGLAGSAGSPGDDDIYVTASGSDIQGTADNFHYVWRTWTGDVTLTARVNGLSATDAWAKAGLMFRESLDANARNASIIITPNNGTNVQSRSSTGGVTAFSVSGGPPAPYWLRLRRTGNVFTFYRSADGITWTQAAGPVTLSLPTTYYVGFAATAHNNTLLTAAQFDHISLAATPGPANVTATAGDAQVVLTWSAAADATSYTIQRKAFSSGIYTTVASGLTSTSYTDTGVTNGDTYYYIVSAVNTARESAPASEVSATLLSLYQQWKLDNGLSLTLADTATPDNDGVPILLKYATGLTPGTPSTAAPAVLSTVNNTLALQFTRLSPAPVYYAVESSTELSTWTTIATLSTASDTWTGPAAVAETGTGATRATTVADTETMDSGPRRFLRLRANTTPLATPLAWITTAPLVYPTGDASPPIVAVKDPTVVFHDGRWHIFATIASSNGWRMGYLNFTSWDQAAEATLEHFEDNPHFSGDYNAAPQIFYFRPHKKWYLIYQSQQPRFSTTDDITDVMSWSQPQDFFAGTPQSVVEGWIDYWIICDDTHAYMFFSDNKGRYYRSRTHIDDFPSGFDEPVIVMQEADSADLFEASCIYRIKDTNQYLLLVECADKTLGVRYFRAFTSDRLDGEWRPLPGADSAASPFAGNPNVSAEPGATPWANGISHGELLREGNDESITIDPKNLQMLYQGIPHGATAPEYLLLPYRLALLKAAPAVAP